MNFKAFTDETPPTREMVRHNCELALRLWRERIKPDEVDLTVWTGFRRDTFCGTVACFGGYLGTWPEFLAIPGTRAQQGMPVIHNPDGDIYDVDCALFGAQMFACACENADGEDYDKYTDYDLIVRRLERRLAEVA